ncbi:MAG: DUF302 domain-containing protein [Planctomycetes bacterium]|nr:DUF302 domain-containing protein [Planctomycetota bacterium]MCW8135337.1 DUF302 domain-containing protein [Planctomycetota bacterium]
MSNDFIRTDSKLSVEQAVAKVQEAAKANGFGVLGVLNLRQIMANKGVEYAEEATVVEICEPNYARRFLSTDQRVAPCLPCRIAVTSSGGKTVVQTVRPSSMMRMFNNAALEAPAVETDAFIEKIVAAAA